VQLPFPIPPLEVSVIIGHTTPSGARVFVRVPSAEPHTLTIDGRALPLRPDPDADFTSVVTVDGLQPDREYPLDVLDESGASVLPSDLSPRVRTLPATTGRLCFAFVSCHLPFDKKGLTDSVGALDALLDEIVARDVRFVVHLGDQVYADPEEVEALDLWKFVEKHREADPRALYHEMYRAYFALPAMRRLHARVPNLMIWDDGEIHDDWGSVQLDGTDAEIAPAMFDAARAAYLTYQHSHNPSTAPGDYHYAFDAGPASFFVLDLRGHRDARTRTLLGARQWAALESWIAATEDRPVRFVVSSVPLVHTPDLLVEWLTRRGTLIAEALPAALHDRWSADAFHGELERLLALLLPRNVIVLSGDVHLGAAIDIHDRDDPSRVVCQWISSAITHESRLVHRLESEVVSRITNLATPWPVTKHFHELRNNFGIVELTRRDEEWSATFDLYVHTGGGRARPLYRVEGCPHRGVVLPSRA